jgi:hypothetical protein
MRTPSRGVITWLAVAVLLLLGCSQASPCEVRGGRCTRTDFICGSGFVFDGFDPACEPNSKCCLPISGDAGAPPDGGTLDAGH